MAGNWALRTSMGSRPGGPSVARKHAVDGRVCRPRASCSLSGDHSHNGGKAFCISCWNCAWNQCPDSGAFGNAPVSLLLLRGLPGLPGAHIASKPLPSSFGMNELEPSDSPGGLIHT